MSRNIAVGINIALYGNLLIFAFTALDDAGGMYPSHNHIK
jgi:hypothetical protein